MKAVSVVGKGFRNRFESKTTRKGERIQTHNNNPTETLSLTHTLKVMQTPQKRRLVYTHTAPYLDLCTNVDIYNRRIHTDKGAMYLHTYTSNVFIMHENGSTMYTVYTCTCSGNVCTACVHVVCRAVKGYDERNDV